ncbi:fatty acid-binding protein 5 [Phascolarctos cinereus]|uniref:Fatty acid-binding protein, epidermal-like n=1 Tax=Phascolarctos cinereus TaxID=38626 RepID=A0A6P5KZS2_PHACI|nr:fatty acid-binding protein, epidermal-like [Phascolarctos cinereus]
MRGVGSGAGEWKEAGLPVLSLVQPTASHGQTSIYGRHRPGAVCTLVLYLSAERFALLRVSYLLFSSEFTMTFPKQLLGRWRLVESKGFDEYMKELGVGMALRKMAGMAKPDVYISENGGVVTIKTESTIKTTQISFKLDEKFDETTPDGRKTQTLCTLDNDTLIQLQEWDGKESTITRKVEDGKLLVDCIMNNVTCHRVYEKAE